MCSDLGNVLNTANAIFSRLGLGRLGWVGSSGLLIDVSAAEIEHSSWLRLCVRACETTGDISNVSRTRLRRSRAAALAAMRPTLLFKLK